MRETGILIKDAAAIERMEKVDTLVVDKTGTLTAGKPRLTEIIAVGTVTEEDLLRAAAAVEAQSEHPLAEAIVRGAQERGITVPGVTDFSSTTAGGVSGKVQGQRVHVGKISFLQERKATGLGAIESKAPNLSRSRSEHRLSSQSTSSAAGILVIADPIKESTPDAIARLHELGIKVIMLTGDNERTARNVARELRIDDVEAGVEPQDKRNRIAKLQESGRIVAMAGDGINDAPALAAADVGIAMGTGTDVAMESADITLLTGDLRGIEKAVRLSRALMRNIRQNLFFAFIYNAAGIPIAAGALYPFFGVLLSPMIAGAAMSLSSVSVIANALRLGTLDLGSRELAPPGNCSVDVSSLCRDDQVRRISTEANEGNKGRKISSSSSLPSLPSVQIPSPRNGSGGRLVPIPQSEPGLALARAVHFPLPPRQ